MPRSLRLGPFSKLPCQDGMDANWTDRENSRRNSRRWHYNTARSNICTIRACWRRPHEFLHRHEFLRITAVTTGSPADVNPISGHYHDRCDARLTGIHLSDGYHQHQGLSYPTDLLMTSVILVIGLGWYQRLSARIEHNSKA